MVAVLHSCARQPAHRYCYSWTTVRKQGQLSPWRYKHNKHVASSSSSSRYARVQFQDEKADAGMSIVTVQCQWVSACTETVRGKHIVRG